MLESKLQEVAQGILGDKITDEDEEEKKKISEALHDLERELDDDIARILSNLRRHLDSGDLYDKFSSSDLDSIVKRVGESIKKSEYTGL